MSNFMETAFRALSPDLMAIVSFALIFTILFAILQKVKIFGDKPETKKFNAIVSISLALLVHGPYFFARGSEYDIVSKLFDALPQVTFLIIAIVMMLVLVGLLGLKMNSGFTTVVGTIALIILILIFVSSYNWFGQRWNLWYLLGPSTISIIVFLLVFGIVIFYVTSEPKPSGSSEKGFDKFMKFMGKE